MSRRTPPLALLALLLAGCGGSNHHSSSSNPGSSSTDTIGPQIALAWPARARDFAAPSAATAAIVTFPNGGPSGNSVSQTLTRPTGTAAVTKTYQLGIAVHPGRHLVRVDFLADANSTFTPLATATMNVTVENDGALRTLDGKPLGTVASGSNVTGLTVADGQTLEVGATTDLVVTAATTGGVVALTPGSVTFALASGAANLTLGTNGSVTGVAAGTATLTATADGVTSPAATVTVLPLPIPARSVAVTTSDFVVDPVRSLLWVTTASGVASLDPATGTLGATINLAAAPSALAITDDGSTLYAGLQSLGTVRRVDLAAGTAGGSFSLSSSGFGTPTYATEIDVQPGSVSTLAILRHDAGDSGYNGPEIFDDGTPRPNSLGIYDGERALWTATNRLVAYPGATGGNLDDIAVDDQGATVTRQIATQADLSHRLVLANGRIYAANGVVTDAASLTALGQLPQARTTNSLAIFSNAAVDTGRKRAYYVEVVSNDTARLHVYDTDAFTEIASHRISGLTISDLPYNGFDTRLSLVGADRLVFRLSDQVVFLDGVSGL